ncbi:MAG TPA: LPP20 family lipoprotein [Gammaproteobacteria bacterium]
MKTRIVHVLFLVLLGAGLAACAGGRTEIESDLGIEDAPDWVNEGSQALNNDDGRLIHGMGSAPKMSSQSLQISSADNRARAEVARVLSSFMNVVSQDYVATMGTGDDVMDEQAISRSVENVTRLNMSGAEIIGHWRDPETGTIYALAELDLDRVKKLVGSANDMHGGLRNHLAEHGETLFDEFAEEK